MDIIKIIGVGFSALLIIIILKQYKPEFTVYVSIIAGTIILCMLMDRLKGIVDLLNNLMNKTNTNMAFFKVLTEFAVSICKDSGETAIASKIDLGGKIIIVSISIPILTALLELIIGILP